VLARTRDSLALALVLVLAITDLAGCRSASKSPIRSAQTLTIGLMAPTSGPNASIGQQATQGAELAVDVVNDVYPDLALPFAATTGLRGGTRLAIAAADTAGEPGGVARRTGELATQRHAVATVVIDSAEVVSAATQQSEQLQVPLLDAATSADYLTELSRDWYFRLSPPDRVYARTALALLRQVQASLPGLHRVVLLEGASIVNGAAGTAMKALFETAGYEVVLRRPAGPVLTEVLNQVTLAHPDVVFALATTPQEAAAVTSFTDQLHGALPVVALGRGITALPANVPAVQPPGVLRVVGWSSDLARRNPLARAVSELYEKRFSTPMTDVAAGAFTAVLTLAQAIDAAQDAGGFATPARVRATLRQLRLTATALIMPWDGVRFSGNGQNDLASGVVEQQLATGFRVVFPRELAATAIGWPGVAK